MLGTVLVVLLVLNAQFVHSQPGHTAGIGARSTGGLGVLLAILVVLLLVGWI